MSLFSVMDPAERGAKYRYRPVRMAVTMALASLGVFLWPALSLPRWVGSPGGRAVLAAAFLLLLKLENRIVPKALPADEDS
jgi:hypothetical protein